MPNPVPVPSQGADATIVATRVPCSTWGASCWPMKPNWSMAALVNVGLMAVLLSSSFVAVVLFVVFTIIGTIVTIGAMVVAR